MNKLISGLRNNLYQIRRPEWWWFRLKHSKHVKSLSRSPDEPSEEELAEKEKAVRSVLERPETKRFLEIGIGSEPMIDRVKLMLANNIEYVACDFESVCAKHRRILSEAGVDTTKIRFLSNTTGTYSWPLFELAADSGAQFDAIYLDGHHTFYVDLPAFISADWLLEPDGILMVDDIAWTLDLIRKLMFHGYGHWYFYHHIYSFGDYTPAQQSMPHIGMITRNWLEKKQGYKTIAEWSSSYWWAGQKAS